MSWFTFTGFEHEQARNDRDDYVTINWDNIEDDYESQFEKCKRCDNQGTPYDYKSVMHYGTHGFSKNGRPTITTKNNEKIGQRNGFSYYDLVELNKAYKCSERKTMTINLNKKTIQMLKIMYIRISNNSSIHFFQNQQQKQRLLLMEVLRNRNVCLKMFRYNSFTYL